MVRVFLFVFLCCILVNTQGVVDYETELLTYHYRTLAPGEWVDVSYERIPLHSIVALVAEYCPAGATCHVYSAEEYRAQLEVIWMAWNDTRREMCITTPKSSMPLPALFFDFVDDRCLTQKKLENGIVSRTQWSCAHFGDFPVPRFDVCGSVIRLTKMK